MAELRPYEPTWRDRLASMMMGDGRASPERRRFVEGLLGSTGLGNTGMGLVDVTPVGGLLQAQEAVREGDPRGAALAVLPIPGAARAQRAANVATDVATPQGIRAYHGSPYDFDRFNLSKIGTGEGAQAYGHGLYFAEAEDVAKDYRKKLTEGTYKTNTGDIFDPFKLEHVNVKIAGYKGIDNAIERARGLLQTQPENADMINRDLAKLMAAKDAAAQPNKGRMYEVNIRANPEDFLDWDRPLSEQPENVRKVISELPAYRDFISQRLAAEQAARDAAIAKYGYDPTGSAVSDAYANPKGSGAYKNISQALQGDVNAANALREAGIPGIKYLDRGSRDVGEGSRNYVVFDENLIDILRKYGLVPGMIGGGAAGFGLLGPVDASAAER